MPLTDTKIRTFKIPDKPVKLTDGGGLYLYCSNTGRKYWRLAYSFDNKAKSLSLGEYPGITLQRAREKRMEAKRLLEEENMKVYEAAEALGFESAFYFSKVFKRVEGVSPTEYVNGKFN